MIQNRLGIFRFDRLELFWYVLETAAFNNSIDHSITTKEAKQNKPPRKTIWPETNHHWTRSNQNVLVKEDHVNLTFSFVKTRWILFAKSATSLHKLITHSNFYLTLNNVSSVTLISHHSRIMWFHQILNQSRCCQIPT